MLALSSSIESVGDGGMGATEPDKAAASFPKKVFLDGDSKCWVDGDELSGI